MSRSVNTITALTAALAFSLYPGQAAEANTPECAEVYDQTTRTTDPRLAAILGRLADQGIAAHVQILDGAAPNGIVDEASVKAYSERLDAECGWADDNDLNVFFVPYSEDERKANPSLKTGKLDISATNNLSDFLASSGMKAAKSRLATDLHDKKAGYQEDLVTYFSSVADLSSSFVTPTTKTTKPNATLPRHTPEPRTDNESLNEGIDIDAQWVSGAMGGIMTVGGAGAFLAIRRRRQTFRAQTDGLAKEIEADIAASVALEQGASLVYSDTEVMDPGLRLLRDETADLVAVREELRALGEKISTLESGVWPNMDTVMVLKANLNALRRKMDKEGGEYTAARAQIDSEITEFPARAQSLATKGVELQEEIAKLARDGWDTKSMITKNGVFEESRKAIVNEGETFVVNASRRAKELFDEETAYIEMLKGIDNRYVSVSMSEITRDVSMASAETIVTKSTQLLERLTEQFDASCLSGMEIVLVDLKNGITDLRAKQVEAKKFAEVKSLPALENAERCAADFDVISNRITALADQIEQRKLDIETLRTKLPGDIASLKSKHESFVIEAEQWGTDIDASVLSGLKGIATAINALTSSVESSKPKYFEIEKSRETTDVSVSAAYASAQHQRNVANQLRSDVETTHQACEDSLGALGQYIQSNPDAQGISINILVPSANLSGTRSQLQSTLEGVKNSLKAINSLRAKAELAVKMAEDNRRAERERIEEASENETRVHDPAEIGSNSRIHDVDEV